MSRCKKVPKPGGKPSLSYMHKAKSFIKCRHNKPVHGGANLFTLEGVEASPRICPRNIVTWVILLKNRRLKVSWLL